MKSSHVTFESETKILDIVRERKVAQLSDSEDESSEEEKATPIGGDVDPGGRPSQDPVSSRGSSPDGGLSRSRRLTQRHWGENRQQRLWTFDDRSSDDGNFFTAVL